MSMDLIQLYPWGDARLEKIEDVSVTFDGKDYSWTKHRIEPSPIARSRTQRLSETELEVDLVKDPAPSDTTAPTLSSASGSATGATTAEGSVDTGEADGVLYHVTTTSSTAPTAQQVQDGQNADGNVAVHSGHKLVGTDGTQGITAGGLSSGTTYYHHFVHVDEVQNESSVATSGPFTTP